MFRFIHSADWQLGARFSQFGPLGARLREARLQTLRATLRLAVERRVDAFFIAGDLFEDNQVEDSLVNAVASLFGQHPALPIYLLPGNHDPYSGPDSVWQRQAFLNAPANVHVLRTPGVTDLGGNTFLLASPLTQKASTVDPSQKLADLSATLPAGSLRIGLTHGSLAIEGKHKPNDFPIALHAASRAGLDYLGIGHWHNWLAESDNGRIVMPGTPEPDRFANNDSGNVALVELSAPGELPAVTKVPVATLAWRELSFDFLSPEASRATLTATLATFVPENTILRVVLTGVASPAQLTEVQSWLAGALGGFLSAQVVNRTRVAFSETELARLRQEHPILAQVLGDIDRLETFATGTAPAGASAADTGALTLAEAQALLNGKLELGTFTPEFFAQLRQTLLQEIAR